MYLPSLCTARAPAPLGRRALLAALISTGCSSGDPTAQPEAPASEIDGGSIDSGTLLDASRTAPLDAGRDATGPIAVDARVADGSTPDGAVAPSGPVRTLVDPGTGPWQPVSTAEISSLCRLDPALLAQADATFQEHNLAGVPWAIIRYGRLCYLSHGDASADEAFSTTKTMSALVLGMLSYQTRELVRTGPKTGPLSDADRVDAWLDSFSYNPDAHIAHVLAMVAHNEDLSLGHKEMTYDVVGATQINSLSDVMNTAIAQDTARLGANLEEFAQRFLFGPLGMKDSSWTDGAPDKILAYSWSSTVLDMARVGLLMLHDGVWNGQRVVAEDYIYRMTHPAFEDANTGYGYLTWLNASSNFGFGDIPATPSGRVQGPLNPGPCAPVSVFNQHPHGLSDSPDCNYSAPYSCTLPNDVGAYAAVGLQGQTIAVHPALDMVIVVKNLTPLLVGGTSDLGFGPDTPKIVWDAVLPAVIAGDPVYAGNTEAFCTEYGASRYVPDFHADERAR